MNKDELLKFIEGNQIAVIATIGDSFPESAVIDFDINEKFEIVFNTHLGSRKYKNIRQHNNVSFVIGWFDQKTVQYEGRAFEILGDSLQELLSDPSKRFQFFRHWKSEEMRYFRVVPTTIKYTDYNANPPKSLEFKF